MHVTGSSYVRKSEADFNSLQYKKKNQIKMKTKTVNMKNAWSVCV